MKVKVLLIEDDQSLGGGIVRALDQYGYDVTLLQDGQSALQYLTKSNAENLHAIILDLGLPKVSGSDVLAKIRERGIQTPVIILTAADRIQDKVDHLYLGADVYMVKPFNLSELDAQIKTLIRRTSNHQPSQKLTLGEVSIDLDAHKVFIKGMHVEFSRREFTLLNKLIEQTGKVVTREVLSQTLYGWGDDVDSNAIEVHVHHIRKKIQDAMLIKTIRGVGYIAEQM